MDSRQEERAEEKKQWKVEVLCMRIKNMPKKSVVKKAFIKSIPILCSYLFVSMAYGMMMENAGFHWYYSLLASVTIYTGAFQFVLIPFLSSGAAWLTIAVTAFLMNSRQAFYSLSFVDTFQAMGKWKLYMIHTMTDETYAVNCTLDVTDKEKKQIMLLVAFLSRCYWLVGTVVGGVIGQLLPLDLKGIDFCMTALFVIIFMEHWEQSSNHTPAIVGLVCAVFCLLLFGQNAFMLPALLLVSGILLCISGKKGEVEEGSGEK